MFKDKFKVLFSLISDYIKGEDMSKSKFKVLTFMERLEENAKGAMSEYKRVSIAKKRYLMKNKDTIVESFELGYPPKMIAEVATVELLKTNVLKSYTINTKDGKDIVKETMFMAKEIKDFCQD